MADDWDLYAVVRSYATASASASSTIDASNTASQEAGENENAPGSYLNSGHPTDFPGFDNQFQGLGQIYQDQQYEYNNPTNSFVQEQQQQQQQHQQQQYITPPFSLYAQNPHHMVQQQQQQPQMILGSSPLSFASANPQPIRSRRRKNQQEKTVHRMTQEELSADTWAWRKYGQKPIKGSPYPRNYYRCSTSKGCVARRQVERCPTDPNMYVVSYSGQHSHPRPTHRSSLAGSTRTKSAAKSGAAAAANNTAQASTLVAAASSSPASGTSFSPAAEDGGADAEEEVEVEVEGWEDDQDEDDDGDGDGDDDNGDDNGEILIPNPFIDHY